MTNIFNKSIFLLVILVSFIFVAKSALATPATPANKSANNFTTPALDAGAQLGAAAGSSGAGYSAHSDPRNIVMNIIRVTFGFLGTLFLVMTIYAGFLWMTAGGTEENIEKAKKLLYRSVIGLIIIVSAYSITLAVIRIVLNHKNPLDPSGVEVYTAPF